MNYAGANHTAHLHLITKCIEQGMTVYLIQVSDCWIFYVEFILGDEHLDSA